MPPKAKVKKGKKGDDDDFWYVIYFGTFTVVYLRCFEPLLIVVGVLRANAGESAGASGVDGVKKGGVSVDVADGEPMPKKAVGFAGLEVAGGEEEEDDQDNLMV